MKYLLPIFATAKKGMKVELEGHYGYRRLVRTMAPMVLMMIVTSVYSIVDGLFVSNFAGSTAFAGMNLIWPVIALVGSLGIMIGTGGSALVSKTLGEGDVEHASRIFSMLVSITVGAGTLIAILLFIFMPQLSTALGSDASMHPYAVLYGRIVICALPAYMLQMAFQPFFMVAERPEMGTRLSIACGVLNIILDAIFVAWFGWGLTGAAIGTAAGLALAGFYPLWYFSSKRNHTQIYINRGSIEWDSVAKSCTNGLSEFVGNIALSILSICYNWQLMKYIGSNGVSAFGIVMYLGFIFGAVFIGYNIGVAQLISFNYGAGNRKEMKSLLHKSLVLISLGGLAITLTAELLSPAIARMFVAYDPSLCSLTVHATRIYVICFLICGFNMFTSAWFTALNNGAVSALAAFARSLVFELAAVFILPAVFGIEGIWYAVSVAEVLALILSAILIAAFRKRYGY